MINIKNEIKVDHKKLEEGFKEAMENPEFVKFIEKIKIDEDTAKKYTSNLEQSCKEFNHCLSCKGLHECKNVMLGYAYLPKKENYSLHFVYKPCHFKNKQDKQYAYLKNVLYYNVSDVIKDASFDKIDNRFVARKEVIKWIHEFKSNYPDVSKGLFLHGSFGCGKTYLISALFHELAKENVKSAIVFWPEFLRNLKASFDNDFEEKIKTIKNVPLLLIDDLGAEATTSWSRDEILCSILQYRMEQKLKTFITSNLNMEELEEHLSITKESVEVVKARRIIERIKQLTQDIEMISKNMRK